MYTNLTRQEKKEGLTDIGKICDTGGEEVRRQRRMKFIRNISNRFPTIKAAATAQILDQASGNGFIMETPKQTANTDHEPSVDHGKKSRLKQKRMSDRPKELPMHPLSFPEEKSRRSKRVIHRGELPLPSRSNLPTRRQMKPRD